MSERKKGSIRKGQSSFKRLREPKADGLHWEDSRRTQVVDYEYI